MFFWCFWWVLKCSVHRIYESLWKKLMISVFVPFYIFLFPFLSSQERETIKKIFNGLRRFFLFLPFSFVRSSSFLFFFSSFLCLFLFSLCLVLLFSSSYRSAITTLWSKMLSHWSLNRMKSCLFSTNSLITINKRKTN